MYVLKKEHIQFRITFPAEDYADFSFEPIKDFIHTINQMKISCCNNESGPSRNQHKNGRISCVAAKNRHNCTVSNILRVITPLGQTKLSLVLLAFYLPF